MQKGMSRCYGLISCLLLVLGGCSEPTKEELRQRVGRFCNDFAKELALIETREQLLASEGALRGRFEALVDLLAVAETLRRKVGPLEGDVLVESAHLEKEFLRIQQIEGGREIIERAQKEPLIRLAHLFERERGQTSEPLPLFVQK